MKGRDGVMPGVRKAKPKKAKAKLHVVDERAEPARLVNVPAEVGPDDIQPRERKRYLSALEHEQQELMEAVHNSRGLRMTKFQALLGESVQDTLRLQCEGNVWEALAVLEAKTRRAFGELEQRLETVETWNARIRRGLGEGALRMINALDERTCPNCGEREDCESDADECEDPEAPEPFPKCVECVHYDERAECKADEENCKTCSYSDCGCYGCDHGSRG